MRACGRVGVRACERACVRACVSACVRACVRACMRQACVRASGVCASGVDKLGRFDNPQAVGKGGGGRGQEGQGGPQEAPRGAHGQLQCCACSAVLAALCVEGQPGIDSLIIHLDTLHAAAHSTQPQASTRTRSAPATASSQSTLSHCTCAHQDGGHSPVTLSMVALPRHSKPGSLTRRGRPNRIRRPSRA